jgi:two-component system sensor histidine kinase EvgS
MRAIRMKWLSAVIPQAPVWQRIPQWVYWVLAAVALLVGVSLVWSSRLKIQIHQRMRAEAQLSDQLAFQRALFEGIPNPVYVRDLTGRLISCNPGYEKSVGLSFEQMNGRRLIDIDLIPQAVAQELHDEYMSVVRNQQPLSVDRGMELGGQRVQTRHWIAPFYRSDGQLQGLLGGWTDITECKDLESERRVET